MEIAEQALLLKFIESLSVKPKEVDKEDKKEKEEKPVASEIIKTLKQRKESLERKNSFNVGDVIKYKDGLKNTRLPYQEQLCIVLRIYDPAVSSTQTNLKENLDIEIGFITEDDEFISFNYDSRRFELYEEPKV